MRPDTFRDINNTRRIKRMAAGVPRAVGQRWLGRRLHPINNGFSRIYLYHIRKAGGTSLYSSVLSLGGEDPRSVELRLSRGWLGVTRTGTDLVVAAHHRKAIERGRYVFGWSHRPAWSISLPPKTFTVATLRDPAERVISLYRYLADPLADADQPHTAFDNEYDMAADGFDRFLERLPEPDLLGQLYMFSRTHNPAEAATRLESCSLFFPLSHFAAGLQALSSVLGRPLPARVERRSVKPFRPTNRQLRTLHDALEAEYELLDLVRLAGYTRSRGRTVVLRTAL